MSATIYRACEDRIVESWIVAASDVQHWMAVLMELDSANHYFTEKNQLTSMG